MSLWGKIDQANNAPKYKILDNSPNTGIQLYGTTVVGLDDGEAAATGNLASPGWTRIQRGKGPVATITITAGGTGYSNTDTVKVSGGTTNAAATLTTNGTGGISTVTITNAGGGFVNNSTSTLAIANSTGGASAGSGATLTFTLGGRANRVQTETLVCLSSMTANGSTL
jgi:hypothetical protein